MSVTVLRDSNPKASKSYNCDASDWILNDGRGWSEYTWSERKALVLARKNKWRIQKGDKYLYQVNVCYGDFNIFRAIPDLHDICVKYDMYQL